MEATVTKHLLIAAVLTTSLMAAVTNADASGIVVRLGVEGGGDDIAFAEFDDGDSEELAAGGDFFAELGARGNLFGSVNGSLETELTVGFKAASIRADNGDITFNRYTANLAQYYRSGRLRLGLGATYHFDPELEIDIDSAGSTRSTADNAFGYMAMLDFGLSDRLEIGIRATQIDYTFEGSDDEIAGNSAGLFLNIVF